jgi:Multicopper oxidase
MRTAIQTVRHLPLLPVLFALLVAPPARATILGEENLSMSPQFNLKAQPGVISTGDGDSMFMWLYGVDENGGVPQYPGPTLIVREGARVTINLISSLPVQTSIVFPGFDVTEEFGVPSTTPLVRREVCVTGAPGCTGNTKILVKYTFTATAPGTYIYHSGSQPNLQVEMGLVGTIIVRPASYHANQPATWRAYGDASTAYDREYLFVVSDADPSIHQQVAFLTGTLAQRQAAIAALDTTGRHAVDWFFNGRNFPDTVTDAHVPWLPMQPYNCFPQLHPGERVLMRIVGAGLDLHPLHTHGQNHLVIARDARVLSTNVLTSGAPVADLPVSDYTTTVIPGSTADAIWGPWTGAQLGWDVYGSNNGHTCTPAGGVDATTHEYCPDHNKQIPVELPPDSYVQYGNFWGGSPYLGIPGTIPPLNPDGTVHVNKNPLAGLAFMWHSHNERELTTNDIFIGGMATMALVLPVGVDIP